MGKQKKKTILLIGMSIVASALLLWTTTELSFIAKDIKITPFNYLNDTLGKANFQVSRTIIAKIQSSLVDRTKLSSIMNISLEIPESTLDDMYRNLPISGKTKFYKNTTVQINEQEKILTQLKLRGDIDQHWRFPKKSFRIRSEKQDKKILYDSDQIELISPKGSAIIGEYLTSFIGKKLDLIVPEHTYANVFINDTFYGLYQVSEAIDKNAFLNRRNLPLGSILEAENISFSRKPGIGSSVFNAPFIWENSIIHDNEQKHAQKLYELSLALHNEDNTTIKSLIDYDYFARLGALIYIGQIYHWDNRHNVKLYFNENKQKFQQIPWDATFLTSLLDNETHVHRHIDITSNDLMLALHKDPVFVQKKYEYIQHILDNEIANIILTEINDIADNIQDTQKRDYFSFYRYQKITKKIWDDKISLLKKSIEEFPQSFKERIAYNQLCFSQENETITIQIGGTAAQTLTAITSSDGKNIIDSVTKTIPHENIFYPGRINKAPQHLTPAPLSYTIPIPKTKVIDSVTLKNTLTHTEETIPKNNTCPVYEKTISIHPWGTEQL